LLIEPGASAVGSLPVSWIPDSRPTLWIAHLDVPDSVVLTSRALGRHFTPCRCVPAQGCVTTHASLTQPIFRSLVPPGTPSYHMGADVGGHEPLADAISAHSNVTIWNAGAVAASASIEVRGTNDDRLLGTFSATIPPNTAT